MQEHQLSKEQRRVLADYWYRRAEGEKTSWVAFGHLLEDLRVLGAKNELVAMAERARDDELRHAGWCRDWAVHFGHPGGEPLPRSEAKLTFSGATEEEDRVLRLTLAAFSETYGCVLLKNARARMRERPLLRLNQTHLADEVNHSRLGWAFLASLRDREKELVLSCLPQLFEALQGIAEGPEGEHEELIGLGYFSRDFLQRGLTETTSQLILPGLSHLGLARS
jgi:hypothetical protein